MFIVCNELLNRLVGLLLIMVFLWISGIYQVSYAHSDKNSSTMESRNILKVMSLYENLSKERKIKVLRRNIRRINKIEKKLKKVRILKKHLQDGTFKKLKHSEFVQAPDFKYETLSEDENVVREILEDGMHSRSANSFSEKKITIKNFLLLTIGSKKILVDELDRVRNDRISKDMKKTIRITAGVICFVLAATIGITGIITAVSTGFPLPLFIGCLFAYGFGSLGWGLIYDWE